ncbi:MAG: hypothetical protein ACI4RR_04775, partial [Eubacterium sp.]
NVKPTPSLYALGKNNIVYIGSFSAMLLPGIRISFMVLTDELAQKFRDNSQRFAQTASKTEQIALCQYIRDGHINSQTRKIRRLYSAKTKAFAQLINENIKNCNAQIGENTLQIVLTADFNKDASVFEKNDVRVFVEKYENNKITLVISPSGIEQNELKNAVFALKKSIEN